MSRHLTEKQLIDYQFKLVPENQADKIAAHLQTCPDCRQKADLLKQKFTALDLLREDTKLSDDLISRVVSRATKPAPPKVITFRKYAWASAASCRPDFRRYLGCITIYIDWQT